MSNRPLDRLCICVVQRKESLLRAAKARIDRMVKDHAKRQDLNAPDWLKQEWRTGNKNAIAATLQEVNFDKATCSHQPCKARLL